MDIKDEFLYAFQTTGFFHFKNILDSSLINQLREGVDAGIESDKKNNISKGNYSYLAQNKHQSFVDLLHKSPLQEYIDLILSETCILHSYNTISLFPQTTNPIQNAIHRDSQRFSRGYLLSAQILYMIDDFTMDNGATYVLPGSQHIEQKPSDDYFYKYAIQLEGQAGDAIVFDSLIWHAGGINKTNLARRGVTKVYTRSFMKQQIDYSKATNTETITKLSERSKRLLGFNVRVPENIEQFLLPVDQRFYKPQQG